MRTLVTGVLFGALLAALVVTEAAAQTFPAKPIRLILPFPPGGTVDIVSRFLGPEITSSTGQPVVIENRPGGATFIGMGACAKSPPDGYTVCISTPDSLTYSPWLYTSMPFDVENDFAGVSHLVTTNALIYTNGNASWTSFKDFVAQAKAKPGTVNFGTWGPGSAPDLYARYINRELGLTMTPVPYKGAAFVLQDVMGGQLQAGYFSVGAVLSHIKAGKIRPLVATGTKRSRFLPDLPALAEFGVDPGFISYFGLYAPAKTPAPVLQRLHEEFTKPLKTPQGAKFLESQTLELVANTPAEFQKFMKSDRENAGRLMKGLGVKPTAVPN
jgi:tripartite-type tricarboxylate transporter receptor subunit TctC